MAVQIMPDRNRPKYAGAQPTPEEAKAALTGYTAYFGTYIRHRDVTTTTFCPMTVGFNVRYWHKADIA